MAIMEKVGGFLALVGDSACQQGRHDGETESYNRRNGPGSRHSCLFG
ncbi:MAG: hypothetical protein ACXW0I_05560 [Methylosarcina sp.]